MGYSLY